MPRYTELEQHAYRQGYREGYRDGKDEGMEYISSGKKYNPVPGSKPKRKLSAWNKYVKANSKKPRFRYRNGKLNLKKMAVAFRKTPAGKKKRR